MEQSILNLFMHASFIVKLVMIILLFASIASWAIIFQRAIIINKAKSISLYFEDRFWSGVKLNELYHDWAHKNQGGLPAIFVAGFKEFQRGQTANLDHETILESAQRAMRIAISREVDKLQLHLSFLATVASTSPYIGLFGTVWGIMHALHALGNVQQATIAMVAPGISETLIATAMGLFAAIPAVIAYNRYVNESERLATQYQMFEDELASILYRRIMSEHA